MELKANERKVVNTQPLDYLFTQGEAGVDCIPIILPLQYGEIDLSALRWSIQLVSEQDTFISKPLSVQAGEDSLTVFWKVDEDCTAVPGRIKLTIVGISEDKTNVFLILAEFYQKKRYISQYNCDKIGAKFNLPFWERID